MERATLENAKLDKQFEVITSMPGIGKILGQTVISEADEFNRFASPGNLHPIAFVLKAKDFPAKKG